MALVAASAGCGSSTAGAPAHPAVGVARAFLSDCRRSEGERANDLLTPEARSAFAGAGSGPAACLRFLGFRDSAEHLSAARQRAMLRDMSVTPTAATSAQSMVVTLAPPGRPPQRVQLERRADEWLLTRPLPADALGRARPARAAGNAAASFRTLCLRHEYDSAEPLLTDSARRDFERSGAKADACLKFLGVSEPDVNLTPREEDALLEETRVADVSDIEPTSAKVAITAPSHHPSAVEAEDEGRAWRLTKPSGSARDAARSLLDSCAHEGYDTAADLLVPAARTDFLAHGGELAACLHLLGIVSAVDGPDATLEAQIYDSEVARVEPQGATAATVAIRVRDAGRHDLRAERHGDEWKLEPEPLSSPGAR